MRSFSQRPAPPGPRPGPHRDAARATVRGRVVSGWRPRPGRGAFTLPEILIAIALLVLVASLVVVNWVSISENATKQPPDKIFQAAVREARFQAMQNKSGAFLAFDAEKKTFVVLDRKTEATLAEFPLDFTEEDGEVEVTFTPLLPEKDLMSSVVGEPEKSKLTLSRLTFHQSGASAPVEVRIATRAGETKFDLDPFCYGPRPEFVR